MDLRNAGMALHDWRDQLAGGAESGPGSQRLIRSVFVLWAIAFVIKHTGSSWDIAWHFRYPFGAFEPPHIVNIFGSAIAAALVVFHTMTGKVTERFGLYIIQGGFALFLVSVLLDVLNHLMFGLDVTVWSPTHLLTFAATTVVMLGVVYTMLKLLPPGRWRLGLGLLFWALLLDDALFQLCQQEYGVIAIDAYTRGQTRASSALLALAGRNPVAFAEGGIPHWIYPIWLITTSTLVLAPAQRVWGWRWSACAVALLYLGFRVLGWLVLDAFAFPNSFIPVMLLGAAFLIDVAGQRRWPPLAISLALTVCYYASALLIDQYTLMPRFALGTAPVVFVLLWGGYALARWWAQRSTDRPLAPVTR
ncbi:MAG: hypothetical protein IPP13_05840 [Kouleothrix sp.]|nr:hypothetical protein [Kouleothrix sp.]